MGLALKYYPDVDILVVELGEGEVADEEWLDNDIIVGYDGREKVVRVEIHQALKRGLVNVLRGLAKAKRDILEHVLETAATQV